jgi:hypothetical protein
MLKRLFQLVRGLRQELVIHFRARAHEVHCERGLRGTHCLDMKIVHLSDVGQACKIGFHGPAIDPAGDGIERKVERFTHKLPAAPQNHDRDQVAYGRIKPQPARPSDQKRCDDHAKRYSRISCSAALANLPSPPPPVPYVPASAVQTCQCRAV